MSGKSEENSRGQLGNCIDSLHHIQQLLFTGHVITDSNCFAASLDKLREATAELSRAISSPCLSTSSSSEVVDLPSDVGKDDVDDFDSMLCDMDDDEFDSVVNSQPCSTMDANYDSSSSDDIPSPCQQHVDKLKHVFGHSQFKP